MGEVRVRKILVVLLLLVVLFVAYPVLRAQKTFNNDSVIKMVQMGFSETMIVDAIDRNPGTYDTSIDALIALKKAGINNNEIQAMMRKETAPAASTTPAPPQSVPAAHLVATTQGVAAPASCAATTASNVNSSRRFFRAIGEQAPRVLTVAESR
jgi:hypothetical protein